MLHVQHSAMYAVAEPAVTPEITTVTPNTGDVAGGTPVTLAGVGFTGSTGVTFGGSAATSVVVVDDSTITCVTPAHAVGLVDVVVLNPSGDITKTNGFEFKEGGEDVPGVAVTETTFVQGVVTIT